MKDDEFQIDFSKIVVDGIEKFEKSKLTDEDIQKNLINEELDNYEKAIYFIRHGTTTQKKALLF